MKILDKYFIKNFLFPLIYCLFLFCFLYIIVDVFGHLDEILRNKVPFNMLLQYYLSFMPLIFVQTAPVAALLSIVYMLSIFNKNNELTAAKACGISVVRLLVPVFAIAIMLSLVTFLINEHVVPKGIVTAENIKVNYIEKSPDKRKSLKLVTNLTVYGENNQLIYAKEFDPVDNKLNGIIVLERDDNNRLRRKILASEAVWTGTEWVFTDVVIYRYNIYAKLVGNPLVFDKKIIEITEKPQELLKHEFQAGYMNYKELKEYIKRLSGSSGKVIKGLKTELYFKTAMPFVPIIIMLLGIPFALSTSRGGAMAGIGVSVVVGLLYYGSIYFILAMGKGGILPPFIAAHLSNIIFFIIAVILLRRAPM